MSTCIIYFLEKIQLNKLNKAYVPILSIKRSLLNISAKSCLLAGLFLILDVVSIIAKNN